MMDPGKDGCNNRLVDGSTRLGYVPACYDVPFLFFTLGCPVWKVTGMGGFIETLDTQLYIKNLTPVQTVHYYAIHLGADRVCHPISYYDNEILQTYLKELAGDDKKTDDSSALSAAAGFLAFALFLA